MGSIQYYFKGSAFAHRTSPILSAPNVLPYVSPSCGCRCGKSKFHHKPWTNYLRTFSPSLSLFLKFILIMGFSWFFTAVYTALHTLDSLTETYRYICFNILIVRYIPLRWIGGVESNSLSKEYILSIIYLAYGIVSVLISISGFTQHPNSPFPLRKHKFVF